MVREIFTSSFEPIQDLQGVEVTEFIGIIVLYSASSSETFTYAKEALNLSEGQENTFRILVEMDNSEKHMNVVGN
jgi:hypothetical protein